MPVPISGWPGRSHCLSEAGDGEQKLLSERFPSSSNTVTHFTSCGTGCLEKPTLPSFYHIYEITAFRYTKHYSLKLIPLMLKTQLVLTLYELQKSLLYEKIVAAVQMHNIS